MEHPLQVDELPQGDNPPAMQAEAPLALQAAPAAAPLPPLPDVAASDVLLLTPSDAHYKDYLPAANIRTQLGPALRAVCKTEQGVAARSAGCATTSSPLPCAAAAIPMKAFRNRAMS